MSWDTPNRHQRNNGDGGRLLCRLTSPVLGPKSCTGTHGKNFICYEKTALTLPFWHRCHSPLKTGFVISSTRWPRCCENVCVLEELMKNGRSPLCVPSWLQSFLCFRYFSFSSRILNRSWRAKHSDFSHRLAPPPIQHAQFAEKPQTRAN